MTEDELKAYHREYSKKRNAKSQIIRVPVELYMRLGQVATGFDSPAQTINKILSYYEDNYVSAK